MPFCFPMIRNASLDDLRSIERIADAAYQQYVPLLGRKPAPMVADFKCHLINDRVIVFERGGQVLGYAIVLAERPIPLLDNIAVNVSVRGQGVGSALIDHIEAHLIQCGKRCYDLYTNVVMVQNIRWYKSLGFVERDHVKEDGFSRIYFRKALIDV